MKKKRMAALICALMVLVSVLAGCGGNGAATQEGSKNKDSVTIRLTADAIVLNPMYTSDQNGEAVSEQIMEPLFYTTPDEKIVPCLATEWEYSNEEKTELIITLRDDVYFHNGEKMTADDVVYSLNNALASSYTANIITAMERFEKVDESHVKLVLKFAFGPIEYCLANRQMVIYPQAEYEKDPDAFNRAPIGTGPYKFVDWKIGDTITLTRNDHYWGEAPAIKDVIYKVIVDNATAAISLESGSVDFVMSVGTEDISHLEDAGLTMYQTVQSGSWQVAFNNDQGRFTDINLRKAVAHAINKEDMVSGALNGYGAVLNMPFSPTAFGYDPSFEGLEYDLDKAKEYMALAGYPDGFDMSIPTIESGTYLKAVEVLQGQLAKIGINVKIDILERGAYIDRCQKQRDYEIYIFGNGCAYPDADTMWSYFHSEVIALGRNSMHIMNDDLDALLEEGRFSTDQEYRKEIYREISELWNEQCFTVPVFSGISCMAGNPKLEGPVASPGTRIHVADWKWAE